MMTALRTTSPGVVELVSVPRPASGPGDVLIRVLLAGICGTDVEIADGVMTYFTSGMATYPVTLGHEWVGEVAGLGAGLEHGDSGTGLSIGDRVVGECSVGCTFCSVCGDGAYHRCAQRTETGILNRDGALAEFVVLPRRAVHRIGATVAPRAAALVEPTAVALNCARLGGVGPGSRVAVVGDGPVGLLMLLVAQALGAKAVVIAGADASRLALARRLGAAAAIDVGGLGAGDVAAAIAAACAGGRPPDVVLEASGSAAGVEVAVEAAAPGATVVLAGLCGAGARRPVLDSDRVVVSDLTLRGALGSPGRWAEAVALIESGRVDAAALVSHELPLAEYARAFGLVRSRAGVKVLLRPGPVA